VAAGRLVAIVKTAALIGGQVRCRMGFQQANRYNSFDILMHQIGQFHVAPLNFGKILSHFGRRMPVRSLEN